MIKVFVDFDGTITLDDVGVGLFNAFGGEASVALVNAYHARAISARQCFEGQAEAVGAVTRDALDAWIDTQTVDPAFGGFRDFCAASGIGLTILSDGLDYYIARLLGRSGLQAIDRHSNLLRLVGAGGEGKVRLAIEFPAENPECSRCACCKRNIMLSLAGEDDIIVYVGEGISDQCPAEYADIVFAKKTLQRYCQDKNISYLPWNTFDDVHRELERTLAKKTIRKRHRAELRRRDAFITE